MINWIKQMNQEKKKIA